jgi:7-cyano-7-deazaguanine reductase
MAGRGCQQGPIGKPEIRLRDLATPPTAMSAYSMAMDTTARSTEFVALGHAGSDHYAGLETFPNPGVARIEMSSDELAAVCPITGQPDLYAASIEYSPKDRCLESKSLKLYLNGFRNEEHFCEALAVKIRDDVAEALGLTADEVTVTWSRRRAAGSQSPRSRRHDRCAHSRARRCRR